jgi:hypothetical protein
MLRVRLLYSEVKALNENAMTILFENIKNTDSRAKMDEYVNTFSFSFDYQVFKLLIRLMLMI